MNKALLFLGLVGACRPAPAHNPPPVQPAPPPVARALDPPPKPPAPCPAAGQVLRDAYAPAAWYARASGDGRVVRNQVVEHQAPDAYDSALCGSVVMSRAIDGGRFRVFLTHERRATGWRLVGVDTRVYPRVY